MEGVVYEGWLVKSPPEKRILKAKWRQRWFVLRHSGLLPGQFLLEYFTDNSCKKLKGRIDLDQCELMVEAGLTFEGKKTSYQYMFDVRTPKRIYYLVAETEAEMNKWVDCICTVCGLKLLVEEDYIAPQEANAVASAPSASNLSKSKSSSNPYIPISECHTGKPMTNGDSMTDSTFSDLPKEAPPAPPRSESQEQTATSNSEEFYVFPRPIHGSFAAMDTSAVADASFDETYKVPSHFKFSICSPNTVVDGSRTMPPRVNWKTHPSDSLPRERTSSLVRRNSLDKGSADAYDIVPPLHSSNRRLESLRKEVQNLAEEFDKAAVVEPFSSGLGFQQGPSVFKAPPRPPKPSKLRDRHDYENFEPIHAIAKMEDATAYDIPPPVRNGLTAKQVSNPIPENKTSIMDEVPQLSSSVANDSFTDDTYDFPKLRGEENINATVPLPPQNTGTASRQRRHAYSNAPPGLFNSKELIFNYEYRPSLMNDYVNMDSGNKSDQNALSETSASSGEGAYANLPTSPSENSQTIAPPAINRGLKPKRSMDKGSLNFLTLQPPPLYKTRANKHGFRKPGDKFMGKPAPSPTLFSGLNLTPPVPNRFRHHPDIVTALEDGSSCNSHPNPMNEDQPRVYYAGAIKKDEIQYLDLDLDSEPSPSPKSPERMSATVYKKVDFVKTKAFNEMRQNVEESYRKSQ